MTAGWPGVAPAQETETTPRLRFADASAEAGLELPTWCGGIEKPHLLESGGGGLAFFDYDGDGDLDLYIGNGWRLAGAEPAEVAERGRNFLYRNRGDGTFEDVTVRAGVGDDGWSTGIAVGDIDGDGWADLFVSNFGVDVLYRNRGDGSFERVDDGPGIDGWSAAAILFDADGDDDADLFVGGYVDSTLDEVLHAVPNLKWEGMQVMLGPFGLEGLANRYFENTGDNGPSRFVEATEKVGLEDVGLFYTFAIAALDLDGDLDLDIYAANDSNPNYIYRNDGDRFEEVGLWSGAALDAKGNAQAGMGLATGDLDNDGNADLLVTNFAQDQSTFYHNLGDFLFEDTSVDLGVAQPTYSSLSWGPELVDLDHDGDLDLFVANGHIYPQADRAPPTANTSFRQTNLLLENTGGGFVDASPRAGPGLAIQESSRGAAAGDVDHDGDVDLAIWNTDAPPSLLRNESTGGGGWLLVDAPRAIRAKVETGGKTFFRHRVIGGSYVSVDDQRLHFGLGPAEDVVRLELTWPNGRRTVMLGLPVDVRLSVYPGHNT
ncbi:MAG: CRTAC1 family protein [bacterium]|nr:CRTAC1 family protein [bacterium]